jgi:osmoprotectant transport system ATP-binding protein
MIEIHGVTVHYGTEIALRGIDLDLQSRRTSVLIGPSGCGKSTLLRVITGLSIPASGYVKIENERITPENISDIRKNIGYVVQSGGLFPHLNNHDNVILMARYLKWSEEKTEDRLNELVNLTRFPRAALNRYPAEISGGQRQRVSLMRALMLDPQFLLLDEPLGALDPMVRFELQRDLRVVFSELKKTVVLVTHDLNEAAYLGDELILMKDGKVVQRGSLESFQANPKVPFVTQFIEAQQLPGKSILERRQIENPYSSFA